MVMRSVLLFISVFGTDPTCVTHASVPMPGCAPAESGFANVDMDSLTSQAVSIKFYTKDAHEDSDRVNHPATDGTFDDQTVKNGRYVLSKKQPKDKKTIKITVTRPADLTEFGGEWVKMYPKDSWTNITNEYEPYSFNDFGSKVPLQDFRPTTLNSDGQMIVDDAAKTTTLNVYMEMSDDGDYEIRYGNPQLYTTENKWIALEFKSTQLRVGTPPGATSGNADLGTIVPAYLGNPALRIHDYKEMSETLGTAIGAVTADKKAATKVILPIFTPANEGADGLSTWTEGHDDVAEQLTASHCDKDEVCTPMKYKGCYSSGRACPLDHSVCSVANCEIQRWNEIIAKFHTDGSNSVEVIGLIETKDATGSPRTAAHLKADIDSYKLHTPAIKGFYFNEAHGSVADVNDLIAVSLAEIETPTGKDDYFTVFGLGQPLFDPSFESAAGAPDVWVTLNDDISGLGVWTPYSWFPYVATSKWAAIVDEVPSGSVTGTLDTLVDRGYGYIYLHDTAFFNTTSDYLDDLIAAIGAKKTTRRLRGLQAQDDGVTTTQYECDDTLFECQPVCMQTKGVTRSKVSDETCSGAKPTHCNCRCYHDAFWTCENNAVVCKATMSGGEEQTVGDLVCITRGTPKPDWDPTAQTRTAGQCEPLEVEQTRRPTEQCMAEYAAKPEEPVEEVVVETTETPATTVAPVVGSLPELDLMGSAVGVAVGAALLALA